MESKRTEEELRKVRFGTELFQRRASGKISEEEFNKEIAYWMLAEYFDDIRYIPMPVPTGIVKEYFDLPRDERKKVKPEFFNDNQEVKDFMSLKEIAEEQNKECIRSLRNILKMLPENDEANIEKVKNKLDDVSRNYIEDKMMYEPIVGGQEVFYVDGLPIA